MHGPQIMKKKLKKLLAYLHGSQTTMPSPGQPLGSSASHSLGLQTQSHPLTAPARTTTATIANHLLFILSLTSHMKKALGFYIVLLSLFHISSVFNFKLRFHSETKERLYLVWTVFLLVCILQNNNIRTQRNYRIPFLKTRRNHCWNYLLHKTLKIYHWIHFIRNNITLNIILPAVLLSRISINIHI